MDRAEHGLFASRRSQLGALVALWLVSSFLCSRFLVTSGSLYLDHLRLYSYSYDNLHALDRFGGTAWWFPHHQGGVPGYVYSQLGIVNAGTPLSALLGATFWLAGRLGIHITAVHAVYVVHHFWVLPALLMLAVWLCARQLFRHGLTIVLVLVLTAFSPAILQNVKDPGFLEITGYGLLFAAAWFHLLRAPGRRSAFWAVVLAACVMMVSIGFSFLVWNVFFLPMVVVLPVALFAPARRAARRVWAAVPVRHWLVAGVVIAGCAVPKLIVFHQRGDLVRANVEQQGYRFEQLRPGNPWQVLLSGVPALGFGNTSEAQYPAGFIAMPTPFFFHTSYLGVLALPLAVFGLMFGRPSRRLAVLGFAVVSFGVILLSANSPVLAPLLMPESPFRSVNHYFDICYGFGGALILVFAAGFGLETFLAGPRNRRWLPRLYGGALAISIAVFCWLFADSVTILGSFFGFYVLTAGLIAIALGWIVHARSAAALRQAWLVLLALVALDVATVAWHYVKLNLQALPAAALDDRRPDDVGITSADANDAANTAFESKSLRDLVVLHHLDLARLPELAWLAHAHPGCQPTQDDVDQVTAAASGAPDASLAIAASLGRDPTIAGFRFAGPAAASSPPGSAGPLGRVDADHLTYNTRALRVTTQAPALLFLRTPYSPYWRATIDGERAPLLRALGRFTAIAVPAGSHLIRLAFAPAGVGVTLLLAWLLCAAIAAVTLLALRRERRA